MQGKINAGTVVVIVVAFGLVLLFWMYKRLIYSPPLIITSASSHDVVPRLIGPAIPKLPTDVLSLLEHGQYHVITDQQIIELGAEIEQYIPQMIEELVSVESRDFSFKETRKPSTQHLLVAAGEFSLPAVIGLLDEPRHWNIAMSVLAEMGVTAQSAIPRLAKKLRTDYNLTGQTQSGHVSKVKDTMNAISPGSAEAATQAELEEVRAWQSDIENRLAQRDTRDAAYLEAVCVLSSENMTRLAVAEEILTRAEFSAIGYEALLELARDYSGAVFLRLDRDGSVNYEQIYYRSTPQFEALCHVLGAHVGSAFQQLQQILDEPRHPVWRLAANSLVVHGNPSEHMEELVIGTIESRAVRWPDVTFKFLQDNRQNAMPTIAVLLADTQTTTQMKAAQLMRDMYGIGPRVAYQSPNQEPIEGLDEVIPELLLASRDGPMDCQREALFLMRFLENPSQDVLNRLFQEVEYHEPGDSNGIARVAFETLYTSACNDPAISQFMQRQTKHSDPDHRSWANRILRVKGADVPSTIPVPAEILAD